MDVYRRVMKDVFVLIEILDEGDDSALIVENLWLPYASVLQNSFISEDYLDPLIEESQLPQPLGEDIMVEFNRFKDRSIGHKRDGRSGPGADSRYLHRPLRYPAPVLLLIYLSIPANLGDQPFREGVDTAIADAVQSGCGFVSHIIPAVELAAGMQDGHNHFQGRFSQGRVGINGNTSSVIGDRYASIGMDHHLYLGAETGYRLIYGVIDELRDEMMKPGGAGGAYEHTRAFSDRL